jgi:ABC-type multidrug transport system permease subunit
LDHNSANKSQSAPPADAAKQMNYKPAIIGCTIIGLAFAAHVSNYLGATTVAAVLAVTVLLSLTVALVWFILRKAMVDAVGSDSVKAGNSVFSQAVWKVLWLVPVILFAFGFAGDLIGFKEEGKWMGVAAVLLLLPVITTYIGMGIARSVRKRRAS